MTSSDSGTNSPRYRLTGPRCPACHRLRSLTAVEVGNGFVVACTACDFQHLVPIPQQGQR